MKYGELDSDAWFEVLAELIRDEGDEVFRHDWDSGGPGAGADSDRVYMFRDLYWPSCSVVGIFGPTHSLEEALELGELLKVTSATTSITCFEIGTAKLAQMLKAGTASPRKFTLNGVRWQLTEKGRFKQVPQSQNL